MREVFFFCFRYFKLNLHQWSNHLTHLVSIIPLQDVKRSCRCNPGDLISTILHSKVQLWNFHEPFSFDGFKLCQRLSKATTTTTTFKYFQQDCFRCKASKYFRILLKALVAFSFCLPSNYFAILALLKKREQRRPGFKERFIISKLNMQTSALQLISTSTPATCITTLKKPTTNTSLTSKFRYRLVLSSSGQSSTSLFDRKSQPANSRIFSSFSNIRVQQCTIFIQNSI